mgnify:CR=1 FL=1
MSLDHRRQRDFQRGRQARQDKTQYRRVVDERAAEVAHDKPFEKREVLQPQWLVEPIRTNGLLADLLRGIGEIITSIGLPTA